MRSGLSTAVLAALAWHGHATHWTFGFGGNHADHPMESPPPGRREPKPATGTVRFSSAEVAARTGIHVVPVDKRPVVSEVPCQGTVAYDERRTAQLSSRVPGSIWRVEKHLGDTVRAGDVLVIIESQDVGRLKAEFLNALVACEARHEQLTRLEEVKGAVMGRQLREARTAWREARNHLMNAEQALVNLGFGISIRDYQSLDDDARAARIRTLGLPQPLVAALDPARLSSNLLPLYAPFDGVVVGREAVVGEVTGAAQPIFEVADVSTMLLVLDVSKENADRVAVGQTVRFRPDGSTREFTSRIAWISTEVDAETRTLKMRAEVPNRDTASGTAAESPGPLRAHTFGTGRIEVDRRRSAVVVPRTSVQWDGSRWVVFVPLGDGTFAARPVEPCEHVGDEVEIAGPITADPRFTHVVANGSHVLKSQILLDRMDHGEL